MSFSLLRVPKRAALTALRGLVVGTSCTLLLILEDRRRRIDQARRAIHNGQRVRAAKQYRKKKPPIEQTLDDFGEAQTALSTTLRDTTVAGFKRPTLPLLRPSPMASSRSDMRSLDAKATQVADKIQRIKEAAALGDPQSLRVGIVALKRIASHPYRVKEEEQPRLLQAALALYRQCHGAGSTDQAARILQYIGKMGPVPHADFYALNPQSHVERALAELELVIQELQSDDLRTKGAAQKAAWVETRLAAQEKLDKVLTLLLPQFQEEAIPAARKWEWLALAEKTIRLALRLGDARIDSALYASNLQSASDKTKVAVKKQRLEGVTKSEPFVRVVKTFVQLQGTLSKADAVVWSTIGNVISDSAHLASVPDAATSLLYLVANCPSGLSLRTTWIVKLLSMDWEQNKSVTKSLALFSQFEALGGPDKVAHLDGVYRIMMKISVAAESWQNADDFLARLVAIRPDMATHPHTLGLLAKSKAQLGDWESVWEDFQRMEPRDHIGDVFVPVLKEFAKTHTVGEVDQFLRLALEELQIPITPYMVTLVGNQYGALRDVVSFVTWLEYCASHGLHVDAAFSNTILRSCRRNWDFDYQALKRVYRTLQKLDPTFVDEVTQNMILSAALTATRRAVPKAVHNEVTTLAIKFRKEAKPGDPYDLRLWMRRAFALRNYRLVQTMYEKAVKQGATLDDGHLLLNIRAILQHNANVPKAVRILREAKEQDILVDRATAEVFTFRIRQVFADDVANKEQILRSVQTAIAQLRVAGLDVSSLSLLRVAYLCLKIQHIDGALSFANSALHLRNATYPDDVPMFQVFLSAYIARIDVRGLKWALRGAWEAGLLHKTRVKDALREARRYLLRQVQNSEAQEAISIVEQALGQVRLNRLELSEERETMERTTMSIMSKAALEVTRAGPQGQDRLELRDEAMHRIEEELEQWLAAREGHHALA